MKHFTDYGWDETTKTITRACRTRSAGISRNLKKDIRMSEDELKRITSLAKKYAHGNISKLIMYAVLHFTGGKASNKVKQRLAKTPEMDFERLYKKYPRLLGKKIGMARCKAQIKNIDQFRLLEQAIDNYALEASYKEIQYVMHFSTFMNNWEDWVDYRETQMSAEAVFQNKMAELMG